MTCGLETGAAGDGVCDVGGVVERDSEAYMKSGASEADTSADDDDGTRVWVIVKASAREMEVTKLFLHQQLERGLWQKIDVPDKEIVVVQDRWW